LCQGTDFALIVPASKDSVQRVEKQPEPAAFHGSFTGQEGTTLRRMELRGTAASRCKKQQGTSPQPE